MGKAIIRPAARDAQAFNVLGETINVLASAAETGSSEFFLESVPLDGGPPPHSHPWDESFYLVSGELDYVVDGQPGTARAGAFVHLPAGTVHSYTSRTEPSVMIAVTSRAGASDLFADLDAASVEAPPAPEKVVEVANAHQVAVG
jgi:mannose-6-phosphate isomerase-like protein (cupin superfamily)